MDRKTKGTASELSVASKLVRLGFTVSWPLNQDAYDLIAEKDGKLSRLQVKTASRNKGGRYRCSTQHGKPPHKSSTKADCDFVVIHAPYSHDFDDISKDSYYVIPVSVVVNTKVAVVFPAGKGKGNLLTCSWEKYNGAWEKI